MAPASKATQNRAKYVSPARRPKKSPSVPSLASSRNGSAKLSNSLGHIAYFPPSSAASTDQLSEADAASPSAGDNINVVVRVRPLNSRESKNAAHMCLDFPGDGQILCEPVFNGPNSQKAKVFSYNVVFEPAATQADILEYSGIKRLINMASDGFNCTAFCYGQTGSGKTHTLTGPPGLFLKTPNPYTEQHGLIVRSFIYLFELIKEKNDFHFVLKASFLEIYNEKVIDLLNPSNNRKSLAVRWSKKKRGFFVENLFMVDCEELDDLLAVLEEGMRNRKVGSHLMNDHSSRSHTILSVYINSEQAAENGVFISRQGKINFVDLAGSEMTKKTQSAGKTLEEANNINKSLMVLGYCIASLSDSKRKHGHIPYRDSQLTKLLADSLAGNGVSLMIACVSPAKSNLVETINTLRYAARTKKIRTKPIVVMDPRESLILSLKRECKVLQSENEHLKHALSMHESNKDGGKLIANGVKTSGTAPKLSAEKLAQLDGPELAELVKLYMIENEALRQENSELFSTREMVMRDQEVVCRENEKLIKKLSEYKSMFEHDEQPLARAHSSLEIREHDNETQAPEIWQNPLESDDATKSNSTH